jgi:hypothetical protein
MGLRVQYYQRRGEALEFPTSVMSIISDGMDQNHCKLPCTGNRKGSEQLTQHLQGSIVHGRWTSIFRSFTTVTKSKSLVIHCVLLELEAFYVAEKRYIIAMLTIYVFVLSYSLVADSLGQFTFKSMGGLKMQTVFF